MSKIIVTTRSGEISEVAGKPGYSVMEILRDNGFDEIAAICGGCCSCATCHVYVDAEQLNLLEEQSEDEHDLVSSTDHHKPESRLSCQIDFSDTLDGLRVTIAPED